MTDAKLSSHSYHSYHSSGDVELLKYVYNVYAVGAVFGVMLLCNVHAVAVFGSVDSGTVGCCL